MAKPRSSKVQGSRPALPVITPPTADVQAESPRQAEEPPPVPKPATRLERFIGRINVHYAILVAVPWLVFLVNPNWIFQGFGHMDPWYYFGMSIDFPRYQLLAPGYSGERLTWVLPSRLFVALFSPIYGWILFHLFVYWTAVFCVYHLLRRLTNARTALIAAVMMACHPLFIASNGWTYLDSGSMAYFAAALAALAASGRARYPVAYVVAAGALWAAGAYNYLLWWLLTPCCVLFYWGLDAVPQERRLLSIAALRYYSRPAIWFGLGIGITTLLMMCGHYMIYGPTSRFFYEQNIIAATFNLGVKKGEAYWGLESYDWIPTAGWIVFPILAFLATCIALAGHLFLGHRLKRYAVGIILMYDYAFLALAYLTYRPNQILQFDYYASILIPLEFLVLGVLVFEKPVAAPRWTLALLLLVAIGISVAPLWHVSFYTFGLQKERLFSRYVIGLAAIVAAFFWRHRWAWAVGMTGLAVAGFGLTPRYPNTAWNWNHNAFGVMKRIVEAVQLVDANTPTGVFPVFWINNYDDPYTVEYRSIMCSLQSHGLSMAHYPEVDPTKRYPAGTELILITRQKDVFEAANSRMTQAGMPLRLRKQYLISGEDRERSARVSYWLTFTDVVDPTPIASQQ